MEENDGERKAFLRRIGTFFFLLGLGVMLLFIASDMGDKTVFQYFFSGLILTAIGFFFWRAGAEPRPPSNRFEGLRRMRQKQIEARAKKEAAKKKK